jgi:hypothetical protein
MTTNQNNGELFKADQILQTLHNLEQQIRERQETALSDEHIAGLIEGIFANNNQLFEKLISSLVAKMGQGSILRGLAREMNPEIKAQVEEFLNQRLTEESLLPVLNKLVSMHSSGEPLTFEPEEPQLLTLEDCKPLTSMAMLTRAMQIVAGENAIY